ncbi:ATP-binding protein [Paenibacillus macerans]|uniref:ATP-binding protein n=1 Tax=Paenibacillus macerans TaxID=44252 RepID=UPI003D31B52C
MLKRIAMIALVALVFSAFIPLSMLPAREGGTQPMEVHQGIMDLSGWDPKQQGRIKLDGEWEFYWNRLLAPEDFRLAEKPSFDAFMPVPAQWNGKRLNGRPLPAYGSATYRMVMKNLPAGGIFALKKTNIRFSSTIYVNGRKLFDDGKPSLQAETYKAGNLPQTALIPLERGDAEIIVQVANYDYINSGIPVSLYFGDQVAMDRILKINLAREFSTLAVLAILAVIFFISYAVAAIYRKKDLALLLSACICLLFSIYHGLSGERTLTILLPHISFEMLYKVKDVATMGGFIFVAVFFYNAQRRIIPLRALQAVIAVLAGFSAAVAFLPIRMYNPFQPYVVFVYELMILWVLYKSASIYLRGRQENPLQSLLLFMSILTINLYSLDTILFAVSWKENLWVEQLYLVLFNLVMVCQVVLKFFEAYHTVDRMKDQLVRLDRIKDDFLASTSHELKTPLNAIVNITDTLLRGAEGPVSASQALNLNIVMSSGRRLTYLVNELLDYSKMKHGDIRLFRTALSLRDHVAVVIQVHLFSLSGSQIALVNRVPEKLPPVYADSNRLIQVLHHLIGYAIKYAEQGIVNVEGETARDQVRVRIRNTAKNLPDDLPQRLFRSFEELGDAVESDEGGTSLGLSMTKELIELHGGTIRADLHPEEGLTFVFTLPRAERGDSQPAGEFADSVPPFVSDRASARVSSAAPAYPLYIPGNGGKAILIAEHELATQQSMRNLLKLEGYSVVLVNRGRQVLEELAQGHPYYLVILDVALPDLSGFEVLRSIRERFSPFELPVLTLTSRNREDDMKLSVENGANDFVGMPFEAEELIARVRSLTNLKASVNNAKDAEIAFLRSQINPHFLYNALNSIAELCLEDPEQAEDLTLELSRYLRGSFDFKQLDSLSTLENELELVAAYVNIEKARFGPRLDIEYDVDADPMLRIPPLVLQPLVENAIRHGLMSKLKGGKVKLTVKGGPENGVYFSVEDNGSGMNEQKLEELRDRDTNRKGVGLWNISQRIKLLYGQSIQIASMEGVGTKVSFEIPAASNSWTGGAMHAASHDRG